VSGIVLVPPHLEHLFVVRWGQRVMSGRVGRQACGHTRQATGELFTMN
jgi:hypothetical protein